MGISNISNNYPSDLGLPLQESNCWMGKVIAHIHKSTSGLISSISSLAQSILSSLIYVGTLGHYTLSDLKNGFSMKRDSSGDNARIDKGLFGNDTFGQALEKVKSELKRHDSKISVCSTLLRELRCSSDPKHRPIYPDLSQGIKLSTYSKTPQQRLAEMEKKQ
ncbi:MAG: hypothetical protein LBC45_04635 [Chlamydiales bacterium]|jgi:hypothetical protein|nr:hypothetical protein [Chlamydiales bacterium]